MHLYSALLCIAVLPKRFYNHVGGGLSSTTTSVQHPLGWCDGCHRTTAPVRSPHTSYRWRGERVIEPIKWMGIIRRPWLTRVSGRNLFRIPLLFTRIAMGFLMTTESQDLGLMSHPKDGAFYSKVSPSLHWPTQTTGWAPPAGLTNTSSSSNPVFPESPIQVLTSSAMLCFSGQPVLRAKEEEDLPACYQFKTQHLWWYGGAKVHTVWATCMFWKALWMLKGI